MTDGKNETPSEAQRERQKERADPSNRVRQGVTGHNVRYVLLFSLLALIACYFLIAAFLPQVEP